ncbi:chemotaxis protein [Pseudomonas coronafaciens pv. porri]|uniref:Chemotaxis protein n=1 Tax=Pseudomonas coronafaciens pv. porri TaxID=83964 RepID=A0ABR5JR14_9PSED|nr:methyl-accepting chemotaxis protein [Pseudomonas coronafaciens]KOP51276.1 chemotaxis protein [Pseudomonas coronafaciens pv. porri]KOP59876.1 chemotaxis protein [Pseudomonas coronafaciens pv. porri]
MNLRKMKIGLRSMLCFGLIAVLVVILGIFGLIKMGSIRAAGELIEQDSIPGIVSSDNLALQLSRVRLETVRLLADPANVDSIDAKIKALREGVNAEFSRYNSMLDSKSERVVFDDLASTFRQYLSGVDTIVMLLKEQKVVEARVLMNSSMSELGASMNELSAKLQKSNLDTAASHSDAADDIYTTSKVVTVFAILATLSLTTLLSWRMTRSLTVPLSRAVKAAQTIAAGDLTHSFADHGGDEAAQLLTSMSSMQATLRSTLEHIGRSAEQLASSSEEMSAVMQESAEGLQQQNSEIEMAATAVTEMSQAVEEVASNAVATSVESKSAAATTRYGQVQLSETLTAISALADNVLTASDEARNLAEQTRSISKVLDVIRAVAEQTNLLALNAAIEAARAGEAGRGFAVVADEVRSLAHRTGESTREIESMITNIQHGTNQTVEALLLSANQARQTQLQAHSANEALGTIAQAVGGIDERNMVIASAAEEQAQVAREVDRNLVRIRDLSVQTSAGAGQTHAASQELSRLAGDLSGLVKRFSV